MKTTTDHTEEAQKSPLPTIIYKMECRLFYLEQRFEVLAVTFNWHCSGVLYTSSIVSFSQEL